METSYINSYLSDANFLLSEIFYGLLEERAQYHEDIVILCIGTDRATGDCLGPITGYKLSQENVGVSVYGTLEYPVHAKNIAETIDEIEKKHNNPLIIAIDASLGKMEHIGFLSIGKGPVQPGAGLNKSLPSVGHIYITGIVNYCGIMDFVILQNTRLNIVMKMADIIEKGIKEGLARFIKGKAEYSATLVHAGQ